MAVLCFFSPLSCENVCLRREVVNISIEQVGVENLFPEWSILRVHVVLPFFLSSTMLKQAGCKCPCSIPAMSVQMSDYRED